MAAVKPAFPLPGGGGRNTPPPPTPPNTSPAPTWEQWKEEMQLMRQHELALKQLDVNLAKFEAEKASALREVTVARATEALAEKTKAEALAQAEMLSFERELMKD